MDIFNVHKQYTEPTNKYNVLSISVFRLQKSYKNTDRYFSGLKMLISTFQIYFPNFYLRIYYDTSLIDNYEPDMINDTVSKWKPLIEAAKNNKYIQLIKYDIQKYRLNEVYHSGLIGTITRFLPFFDFNDNKNINTVITSDIDIKEDDLKGKKGNYMLMQEKHIPILFRITGCYNTSQRFYALKEFYNVQYAINAGDIYTDIKFPVSILNDFFNSIDSQSTKVMTFYKALEIIQKYDDKRHAALKQLFPYGIDEFLCLELKKYVDDNQINHMFVIHRDVAKPIYYFHLRFLDGKISESLYTKVIKYLLGKLYDDNKDAKQNYETVDKLIFRATHKDPEAFNQFKYVLRRYQRMMRTIKDNDSFKKYGFTPEETDCIVEQTSEITYINFY